MDAENALYLFWLYRVVLSTIRSRAQASLKPIQPASEPRYKPETDVTVIAPILDFDANLLESLDTWITNRPKQIIITTPYTNKPVADEFLSDKVAAARQLGTELMVVGMPVAAKRPGMVKGVELATSDFVVFVDDDTLWQPQLLKYLLAPFEVGPDAERVGGTCPHVAVHFPTAESKWNMGPWTAMMVDYLAAFHQQNVEALNALDGSLATLTGRTSAYRTAILRDPAFTSAFLGETWRGKIKIVTGDDTFATWWLLRNNWLRKAQTAGPAVVYTRAEPTSKFLKQYLRWVRDGFRMRCRCLWYTRQARAFPWFMLKMVEDLVIPYLLVWQGLVIVRSVITVDATSAVPKLGLRWSRPLTVYLALKLFQVASWGIKQPYMLKQYPALLFRQFYTPLCEIYAMCTLNTSSWLSRPVTD